MKETAKQNEYVFQLWNEKGLTFLQISEIQIPSFVSMKRIWNIVSGGKTRLKSEHEKKIYSAFRMKFLELKDIKAAKEWVYNNQPSVTMTERNVRYIVNKELKRKVDKNNSAITHVPQTFLNKQK